MSCQKCNLPVPIVRRLPRSHSDRITILEKRKRQAERYHNSTDYNFCKSEREELAGLLKQEAKNDILKGIPLYSSKSTGFRLFCSPSWDKAYFLHQERRKNARV
jgi:hypothetical protein